MAVDYVCLRLRRRFGVFGAVADTDADDALAVAGCLLDLAVAGGFT